MTTEPTGKTDVERVWVRQAVTQWLGGTDARMLLITGPPGAGKTVLARQLGNLGWFSYQHFCRAEADTSILPVRSVSALAEALAAHRPGFAEALIAQAPSLGGIRSELHIGEVAAGAVIQGVVIESLEIGEVSTAAVFDRLIRAPLQAGAGAGPVEPVIVLVDALDEALTLDSPHHLVELVARLAADAELPVRFVATARSGDLRITDRLRCERIDLVEDCPGGLDEDLLRFARSRLAAIDEPRRADLAGRVASAAAGNFLYAHHVLTDLIHHATRVETAVDPASFPLPADLPDVYRRYLQREIAPDRLDRRWRDHFRPVLGLLAVSRGEGLSIDLLAAVTGFPRSQLDDVLHVCGQLLAVTAGDAPGRRHVRLFHRSFQEFLIEDSPFVVYPDEAHARLAQHLLGLGRSGWRTTSDPYALAHLPDHLAGAGWAEELYALARSTSFLQAQEQRFGRPDLPVATMRTAQRVGLGRGDASAACEMILRASRSGANPLDHLADHGLDAALRRAGFFPDDVALLWTLLICRDLAGDGRHTEARQVLNQLIERKPGPLPHTRQYLATTLLASVVAAGADVDPVAALAPLIVNSLAVQYLVSHLLVMGNVDAAGVVAAGIVELDVRCKTLTLVIDHALLVGAVDSASGLAGVVESADSASGSGSYGEIGFDRSYAIALRGDLPAAEEVAREAVGYFAPLGPASVEPAERVELSARASYASWRSGDRERATALIKESESLTAAVEDLGQRIWAWMRIATVHLWQGSPAEARRALRAAADLIPARAPTDRDRNPALQPHSDAFHGPCLQGVHLRLTDLAVRAGDLDTAYEHAAWLAEFGAPDADDALAAVTIAAQQVNDKTRLEQVVEKLDALLNVRTSTERFTVDVRLLWRFTAAGMAAPASLAIDGQAVAVAGVRHVESLTARNRSAKARAAAFTRLIAAARRVNTAPQVVTTLTVRLRELIDQSDPTLLLVLHALAERLGDQDSAADLRPLLPEPQQPVEPELSPLARRRLGRLPEVSELLDAAEKAAGTAAARSLADRAEKLLRSEWAERKSSLADFGEALWIMPSFFFGELAEVMHRIAQLAIRIGDSDLAFEAQEKANRARFEGHDASGLQSIFTRGLRYADQDQREGDSGLVSQVQQLCDLATIAKTYGRPEGRFLKSAADSLTEVRHPQSRSRAAHLVAVTAMELGVLELVGPALGMISVERPQRLGDLFVRFCDAADPVQARLPSLITDLLFEPVDESTAIDFCGGLGLMHPREAVAIATLL